MKSFKFLPVSYRISIIIALALCAEHSSACNWFKSSSKTTGHNFNHKLITSSNQRIHKKAEINDQITPYIKSQQEPSNHDAENKDNAWKLLFEVLGKMSKSNNPVKFHVGSIQESSNHDAGIKEIVWNLVAEALDKITITNNPDAATKENSWYLIQKVLDKIAKTFSQVTDNIHLEQGSDNQDSTIKDMAWNLLTEALGEMFKTNFRIEPQTAETV